MILEDLWDNLHLSKQVGMEDHQAEWVQVQWAGKAQAHYSFIPSKTEKKERNRICDTCCQVSALVLGKLKLSTVTPMKEYWVLE